MRRDACRTRCLELDPVVQLTLFRVAQEALANLLARGGAKHVELVIEPEGEGYLMTVGDDGAAHGRPTSAALACRACVTACRAAGGRLEVEARARAGQSDQGFRPAICSSIGMS